MGKIQIQESSIQGVFLFIELGKPLNLGNNLITEALQASVMHLYLENSNITNTYLIVEVKTDYSFIAIRIVSCLLKDSYIWKNSQGGIVSALIEHCTLVPVFSDLVGIDFVEAIYLIVRNSHIQAHGKECIYGCAIYIEGTDILNKNIPGLRKRAELLACPLSSCDFLSSSLIVENTIFTGAIYTAGSVVFCKNANLEMKNIIFDMSITSVQGGFLHYSFWQNYHFAKFLNLTVNAASSRVPKTIFTITSVDVEFQSFEIFCSQALAPLNASTNITMLFRCDYMCAKGSYTLTNGSAIIKGRAKGSWVKNITIHKTKGQCFSCPVGADCRKNVKALPGYWGYTDKRNFITMIRCPKEYCCIGKESCRSINSCNKGRTGVLCGICETNYTETLLSSTCVSRNQCHTYLILTFYALTALGYAVGLLTFRYVKTRVVKGLKLLYFKITSKHTCGKRDITEEVEIKLKHSANVESGSQKCVSEQEKENVMDHKCDVEKEAIARRGHPKSDSGLKYMQILFFYVQDAILFKVYLPKKHKESESIIVKILQFSPEIFALYTNISYLCLTEETTAVIKVIFQTMFGPCVILILLLIYFLQKVIFRCIKRCQSVQQFVSGSLVQAFLLSCILSFQQTIIGVFHLIQCVTVGNSTVLYVQGNIQCYFWWQNIIQIYLFVNVIPLIFVLSHLPFEIKDKKISVRMFIFACILPLPFLAFLFWSNFRHSRPSDKEKQKYKKQLPDNSLPPTSPSEEAIVHTLLVHYKCLKIRSIRFTWLGIHKIYRILLVVCNTYITEPVQKLCSMIIILLVISLLSSLVKPCEDNRANVTASISYVFSLCIAMINLWKTALVTFDCKTNCSVKDAFLWYFDMCENVLLNLVPIVAFGIWFLYSIVEKCCIQSKQKQLCKWH